MTVYPVREDTLLVKENIEELDLEGKEFLEIGIGNGEISLAAADGGASVTGVDINPEAVKHTKERLEEAGNNADIFESDLFKSAEGKFDFIVFNPPYLSGPDGIGDEEMWRGGKTGLEVAERFLKSAGKYLSEDGFAWIILSSRTDYMELVESFDLELVDSEELWFETLFLYSFE